MYQAARFGLMFSMFRTALAAAALLTLAACSEPAAPVDPLDHTFQTPTSAEPLDKSAVEKLLRQHGFTEDAEWGGDFWWYATPETPSGYCHGHAVIGGEEVLARMQHDQVAMNATGEVGVVVADDEGEAATCMEVFTAALADVNP